jgi:ketosteroid isomerase-like protein
MAALSREDLDGLIAESHPDGELIPLMSTWPQPYHGHDGLRQWFADMHHVWDEFVVQPTNFRELDDGVMLVDIDWRAVGRGGAPELEGPAVVVFRFRDGKAFHAHVFVDEERALKSLS